MSWMKLGAAVGVAMVLGGCTMRAQQIPIRGAANEEASLDFVSHPWAASPSYNGADTSWTTPSAIGVARASQGAPAEKAEAVAPETKAKGVGADTFASPLPAVADPAPKELAALAPPKPKAANPSTPSPNRQSPVTSLDAATTGASH